MKFVETVKPIGFLIGAGSILVVGPGTLRTAIEDDVMPWAPVASARKLERQ